VDGDAVLLIAARSLKQAGRLTGSRVISTVMSNLGLERALGELGIEMVRTPVGDKYVLEEMIRTGAALGGEQSGHVIFREFATTGDGMLTALRVFEIAQEAGRSIDGLTRGLEIYPQLLVNIRVTKKQPLDKLPEVKARIEQCEREFGKSGRVLVRFSGTEPLARVMVEGPAMDRVTHHAHHIAEAIRTELT
jgi:phosphoglucosamine mutase